MKSFIGPLFCGLTFMLLQTTIFPQLLLPELRPNLLLLLVLYLGLSGSFLRAAFLTLLLGALQDVFCGSTFGLYATVQLMVFLLIRLVSDRLNVESRPLLLGLIGAGTILQSVFLMFLLTTFAEAGSVLWVILPALPAQILVNIFSGWLLLMFLLRFQPLLGARQGMAGLPHQSKHHGA